MTNSGETGTTSSLVGGDAAARPSDGVVDGGKPTSVLTFDKDAFKQVHDFVGLRCPVSRIGEIRKKLKACLLARAKLRVVLSDTATPPSPTHKVVVLSEDAGDKELTGLSEEHRALVKSTGLQVVTCQQTLGFEHVSTSEILKKLLPAGVEIVTSFETVGHIAHINLRESLLPYKRLVGEVILEKNKAKIRTVVNKTTSIATQFREFPMEVIAGEDDMVAQVKEHGHIFRFDYSKVYWNSRLDTEHHRLVSKMSPGQVVADAFAGVGPFAVPAAAKGCVVHANDLNPHSYRALVDNAKQNRVDGKLRSYNLDAREFIRSLILSHTHIDHVCMNLPASAVEFLDVFCGVYAEAEALRSTRLPLIHCYCFSRAYPDYEADVLAQAKRVMRTDTLDADEIYNVRNVAPRKDMMCLSFRLTPDIAFGPPVEKRGMKREADSTGGMDDNEAVDGDEDKDTKHQRISSPSPTHTTET